MFLTWETFQQTGINVPYVIAGRRPGDIAESYADIRNAASQLGFKPRRSLRKHADARYGIKGERQ